MKKHLLASALLATSLPAATVVSDTLNGPAGTNLAGTAPDVGPAATNWVGNTGFKFVTGGGITNTNATLGGIMASVNLGTDYMVNNMGVHTVTMNVTTTATDTDVIGIGFGTAQGTGLNQSFANGSYNGTPWMFLRANGEAQVRSGPNTLFTASGMATTAMRTLQLVLNNSGSVWTIDASVDGVALDLNGATAGTSYPYAINPTTISNVGFTYTETDSFGTATNFLYDFVPVPEPSTALLGAIGALALLRRRR